MVAGRVPPSCGRGVLVPVVALLKVELNPTGAWEEDWMVGIWVCGGGEWGVGSGQWMADFDFTSS